jgi:hypothetical protein
VIEPVLDELDCGLSFKNFTKVNVRYGLDYGQGKHDKAFVGRHSNEARVKSGGTQVWEGIDYKILAAVVPKQLLIGKLKDLANKAERTTCNFSVQKIPQTDKLCYEISAQWERVSDTEVNIVVFYHCYPPGEE